MTFRTHVVQTCVLLGFDLFWGFFLPLHRAIIHDVLEEKNTTHLGNQV